mgnify:FL=1
MRQVQTKVRNKLHVVFYPLRKYGTLSLELSWYFVLYLEIGRTRV